MAIIKSGITSDQLTIDPTSKAARITPYDTTGAEKGTVSNPFAHQNVSGASSDVQTIDPTSKAARVTLYNTDGTLGNLVSITPTYSASATAWAIPATPTDMFTIFGSGTKTIKVYEIVISGNQTTAGINTFFLIKRSTADSGGTSSNPTVVRHDTNDAAGTATVSTYTANPTLGGLVGVLAHFRLLCPAPAGTTSDFFHWKSGNLNGAPVVLRGTGQGIVLSFNGVALPAGMSLSVFAKWTEE